MWSAKYDELSLLELLNNIKDIAALTISSVDLQSAKATYEKSLQLLGEQGIQQIMLINHLEGDTPTNYKAILSYFRQEGGLPFEIQFTDEKNLQKRNETHDEFRSEKYRSLRKSNISENLKN